MGMQQLLMITLGVIIVGIMIVVGIIPAFDKGMESANRDAVTQDCLKLAAGAQAYYLRPRMYGGGGSSFKNIRIDHAGMTPNAGGQGENHEGWYEVDGSKGEVCIITGYSKARMGAIVVVAVYPKSADDPYYAGW